MIIHWNIIQGTPEWDEIRRGKLTASHGTAIGNSGKGLNTYVRNIVKDMIVPPVAYTNKDIERGNLLEPIGRQVYELENGVEVDTVGFVEYSELSGCSPDGLVGSDGLIEIKARNDEKHFGLILNDPVDSATIWQMQCQMLMCERDYCDFVSYNPNFKQSLVVRRFERDEVKIQKLIKGLEIGEKMLKELITNLEYELS